MAAERTQRASASWTRAPDAGEHLQLWMREPFAAADLERLSLCSRDEPYWQSLPKLAQARRSSVARVRLVSGPAVVKRYTESGGFWLLTFAQRSRAQRESCALELVAAVLPDNPIHVLAWAERRRYGFVGESYVITSELEQSFDLRRVKNLGDPLRGQVIAAVLAQLPQRVARLHAANVFAKTLRGKNILFQPATGRIALIDLPYARTVDRLSARQRVIDLAILSLELRRFLDAGQWARFLRDYLESAGPLSARDAECVTVQRVERSAARLGHRTVLSAARKELRRRFRRSRMGEWMTGHRYREEPE